MLAPTDHVHGHPASKECCYRMQRDGADKTKDGAGKAKMRSPTPKGGQSGIPGVSPRQTPGDGRKETAQGDGRKETGARRRDNVRRVLVAAVYVGQVTSRVRARSWPYRVTVRIFTVLAVATGELVLVSACGLLAGHEV